MVEHDGNVSNFNKHMTIIIAVLISVTFAAVLIPFYPLFPFSNSEVSWAMAMNQGVAQGLVFGKDLIFTFGPFSSVFT